MRLVYTFIHFARIKVSNVYRSKKNATEPYEGGGHKSKHAYLANSPLILYGIKTQNIRHEPFNGRMQRFPHAIMKSN